MPTGPGIQGRTGGVSVLIDRPASSVPPVLPETWVLLAHGAGGHRDHPHIVDLAGLLRGLGLTVARYNFPYTEKALDPRASGTRSPPNPMPVLVDTVRAVAEAARGFRSGGLKGPERLLLAGHSMGGRASSMAVAEGLDADGLLLFSYPWHPPGRPDKPRVEHLSRIAVPTLCFTGTRDAFCERERLPGVFDRLPPAWTQAWLEGADHGLETLKRSGRGREDVLAGVAEAVRKWLAGLPAVAAQGG
jgi:predicted alpha/beta-hydrolase family hydrolase